MARCGRGAMRTAASGIPGGRAAAAARLCGTLLPPLLLPTLAAAQIAATPVVLDFTATSATEQRVTVTNRGQQELNVRFYVGDYQQDERGGYRYLQAGAHPRSCAERVTLDANHATLAPGGQATVRIRMEPGSEVCWSFLFVEGETPQAMAGNVMARPRIGIKLYGLPGGTSREGEIEEVEVARVENAWSVGVAFANTGELPLRPKGYVEIHSARGEVAARAEVRQFGVLPGHSRRLLVPISAYLPPGRYVAVPVLDFDGEYLAGAQKAFQVP